MAHWTIANRLRVHRHTVDNYLEKWVTAKQLFDDEKAKVDDAAISVIVDDIVNKKSVETSKWWARLKLGEEFTPEIKHNVNVTWAEHADD